MFVFAFYTDIVSARAPRSKLRRVRKCCYPWALPCRVKLWLFDDLSIFISRHRQYHRPDPCVPVTFDPLENGRHDAGQCPG
jgi:hypothetical protein